MTPKTEMLLMECVTYHGLQVEYVFDLPDNVAGLLEPGPNPNYIFINAHKSSSDHVFTIAHELGHYLLHLDRRPRNFMPSYLDGPRKSKWMMQASREIKDFLQQNFHSEWEADLWAFNLLWLIGAVDDLVAIIKIYPEKRRMFWYSGVGVIYHGLKQRGKNFFQALLTPGTA